MIPGGRQINVPARWALLTPALLLGPLVVVLDRLDAAGDLTLFVLAAVALLPLAWLIGEATENLAFYTGPAVGGFLNATFGNAPELIIAIVAVSDGLTEIVRASLVGSVASNLLLVLGFTLLLGRKAKSIGGRRTSRSVLSALPPSSSSSPPRRGSMGIRIAAHSPSTRFPWWHCSWSFA